MTEPTPNDTSVGVAGDARYVSPPVLPRAGASWPPPPEVTVDYHRNQVLALKDNGEPFSQYVECSAGCGYVIGCGDAIDSATHGSCFTKEADRA